MYDTTKVTDDLSLQKILSYVDEHQIYNCFLNTTVKLNKPTSSPFREDKNPSWSLFKSNSSGDLMWKDFATGETGNVVQFVMLLYNLTYWKALEKIWDNLIAGKGVTPTKERKSLKTPLNSLKTHVGIKRKNFSKIDDEYWGQYGITRKTLKDFDIYPIERFWINDILQPFIYSKNCPMYAFKIFDKFKIYRPLSTYKKDKWRSNCTRYDIQGYEQLQNNGDLLIITKSLKDVMVLSELGYASIAPQSEHASIPTSIMKEMKARFKNIVIFFDYDEGGVKGAEKLSEKHDIPYKFISKHYLDLYDIKDISDFRKEMGEEETINLLKDLFNEIQEESITEQESS